LLCGSAVPKNKQQNTKKGQVRRTTLNNDHAQGLGFTNVQTGNGRHDQQMYKRATVDMTNVFCGNKFCSIECVLVGLVPAGGPMELMLKMGPDGLNHRREHYCTR